MTDMCDISAQQVANIRRIRDFGGIDDEIRKYWPDLDYRWAELTCSSDILYCGRCRLRAAVGNVMRDRGTTLDDFLSGLPA